MPEFYPKAAWEICTTTKWTPVAREGHTAVYSSSMNSLILFGGLLVWAVLEVVMINRSEAWVRPAPGEAKKDILLVVITIVMFLAITFVHNWLGVWPFPG